LCFSTSIHKIEKEVTPVNETSAALLISRDDEMGDFLPCRREDPELWFAESPADLELAKSYCLDCPLRAVCLAGALERREPWGVWGGELFERGAVIARKRPRGRPRKTEVAA